MKRKTLWISIIGILLIGFVCLFCYQHYIRQKQIEQKKHTGLVSEDFPVQDIKHQSKNIYEDAYQTEADNQLQNMKNNNSYTIEAVSYTHLEHKIHIMNTFHFTINICRAECIQALGISQCNGCNSVFCSCRSIQIYLNLTFS